jgi:aspartate/methionine/tyrosine aminotransferase
VSDVKRGIGQSRRIAAVQTPIIPTVQRWVRATPGTISLGQGIVAYGPPAEALEAARRFGATSTEHMYGPVEGLAEFTDALEQKLARENNITVRPDSRIVVTAGSNMGFMNAILAILDPGDEVIIPVPYYFNHEMGVVMVDGRVVTVHTRPDYQLDLDAIADAITPRTRAVLTVSPNNPTGVVYPEADLRALNAICRDRGIFHLHDEAYEYFTYGNAKRFSPGSIQGAGEHTISMFSLSKGYGMASWRVGYMVIPHRLFDAVNKIQDTVLVCPPAISQMAGLAAVKVGRQHSAPGVAHLDRMRQVLAEALAEPDLPCETPAADGAFYFFTRVLTSMDPMAVAEQLIREHRVAVMPGTAFGAQGCHFRLSYGLLEEGTAKEGVDRLIRGLRAISGAAVR